MTDSGIGRLLVAALHQAIGDVLPSRLEFYENWLHQQGLRDGTIGLAPLAAVLSFLRREGEAYPRVMARAGEFAAEWAIDALPAWRRRVLDALPPGLRRRRALALAGGLVKTAYTGSRVRVTRRRGVATIEIRGSIFCVVRQKSEQPLCQFYAAAISRTLAAFGVDALATVTRCAAAGGPNCAVMVEPPATAVPTARAAAASSILMTDEGDA